MQTEEIVLVSNVTINGEMAIIIKKVLLFFILLSLNLSKK